MIKVTVAIPVYNDDQFIEKCINSVLNQSLSSEFIEIICINDGSTDNSANILENYAEKHKNIKVKHQENSGTPSVPRNKAIDLAQGEYIYFVDADDYLGEKALEKMLDVAKEYDCDIVVGKYKGINRGVPTAIFNKNPEFFNFFGSNAMYSIGAQKFFKVSFLRKEKIRFLEDTNLGEDQSFTAPAFICSNGIGLVKDYDCYYATNYDEGSRVQLTKQERSFNKVYHFIHETLKVINSLNIEEDQIKKGLYHYWDRILNVELIREINKNDKKEEKLHNLSRLSPLAIKYNPGKYLSLFSPMQKLKFRLLEKGLIEDLIDYSKSEKLQKDLRIYQGELYPINNSSFNLALEENVNFTKNNKFVANIQASYLAGNTLVVEGYSYHSRLSALNQSLFLKVNIRGSKEVLRVKVNEGLTFGSVSNPLVETSGGKEIYSYFHGKIDLSFVKNFTKEMFLDFSLVSIIQEYQVETRMKIDENYFKQVSDLISGLYSSNVWETTPYKTMHGNFSLKIRKIEKIEKEILSQKTTLRIGNELIKGTFEINTKYSVFFEKSERSFLIIDGFLMDGDKILIRKIDEQIIIHANFPLGKLEKRRISINSDSFLVINGIELPLFNISLKK